MRQLFILCVSVLVIFFIVGCTQNSIETPHTPQEYNIVNSQKTTFDKETAPVTDVKNQKSQVEIEVDKCSNDDFNTMRVCYTSEAQAKKDPNLCNKIGKELAINDCLFDVATYAGSAELCKKVPKENDRIICFFHVGHTGKDIEGCKNLPDKDVEIVYRTGSKSYAKKKECFKGFYGNIADDEFKKFDKSVCNYFENSAECLGRLAKLKGDYTTCDKISCVIDIAKSKGDLSLCDEAKRLFEGNWDETIQEECKEPIAIEKGDASICKTTSCFFSIAQKLKDISICFMGGSRYCYENAIGYDADLTIDDCNKLKEKCLDCFKYTYDECLLNVMRKKPDFKEEDCNVISDESVKRKCVYETYEK